jgi:uncharacterized peroxidase-related enzyme
LLSALERDWRLAELGPRERALCAFAEALTLRPSRVAEAERSALRSAGFADAEIHEGIQVVSYFNYINRIAEGVEVDLEPEMPPRPR